MSEQTGKPPPRNVALSQDPLVDQLRPLPTDRPPEVVELLGFIGRDTEDGYWRLYLDTALDTYLRISESDVVATGEKSPGDDVLAPSRVTVKSAASVEKVETVPLDAQASFLQGNYTAATFSTAAASRMPAMDVRSRRLRRAAEAERLEYPVSNNPYLCVPQITIELHQSCYCTIFCVLPAR
ncbi:hypothetical protein ACFVT6_24075 [Streptomyces sp. NPDC058049]|uniref:hypothetical protein n=1 Tax=Streptomyces sp. NPDC058049 TaxID=3346314 RepID=UPI0036E430F6